MQATPERKRTRLVVGSLLNRNYYSFLRFLMQSAVAGATAGMVAVGFRVALTRGEAAREMLLAWARRFDGPGWLILPVIGALLCLAAALLTAKAPETAGSGIPHVEAVLAGERPLVWWRVLPVKFAAGLLAIASGYSLGREGPTIQMGAAAGQAASRAMRRSSTEELQLIACGAGAGLSAAFNAPLAGIIFVLEELRRNFSPYALGGALVASLTANIVCLALLGPLPTFRLADLAPLPLASLPLFIALGGLLGILGAVFNSCLLRTLRLADRLAGVPLPLKAVPAAIAIGLVGYWLPQVLGGGHDLTMSMLTEQAGHTLSWLLLLFAGKFTLTMLSYGVGLPGGIFMPLLSIGAVIGAFCGRLTQPLFPGVPGWVSSFAAIAMAGYFVAIVRAPLTGIVLLTEMIGKYQHMPPLLLCCLAAYAGAEALGSLPVYESLLERQLGQDVQDKEPPDEWGETVLVEMAVEGGSPACNRRIGDLALPAQVLLVAIRRGARETIPRGHSTLREGDVLRIMLPKRHSAGIRREVAALVRYGPRP